MRFTRPGARTIRTAATSAARPGTRSTRVVRRRSGSRARVAESSGTKVGWGATLRRYRGRPEASVGLAYGRGPRRSAGYHAAVIARPTRGDWLTLLALGFMWGTSYVFIRLGVETL